MKKIVLVLFLFFYSAYNLAQDARVGDEISGTVNLGKRTFALPPGKWRVIAENTARSTYETGSYGAEQKRQYLVQLNSNNQLIAGVFVSASLSSQSVGSWNDSTCDRKDLLFRDTLGGNFQFPECHIIDYVAGFWAGDVPTNEFNKQVWNWFRGNKVTLPHNIIYSAYVKYFSGDFVRMTVQVNPALTGLDDTNKKVWGQSPWHVDIIKSDMKRQAYVADFTKWSEAQVRNARATLRDSRPMDRELPALPNLTSVK